MKKRLGNKRGELTTQQLVVLIILIISFAIMLFLLFRMNLRTETNKEICHNSVVLLEKKAGLFGALDCKTNYVCISGGKECDAFNSDYKSEISLSSEEPEKEIDNAIQKEVDDCWWMFGEGKIDYVSGVSGYRCAICSTIRFDSNIREKYPQIIFNETTLFTDAKYLVITGMNPTLPLVEDKYIGPPVIVNSENINSMDIKCKEFITKA